MLQWLALSSLFAGFIFRAVLFFDVRHTHACPTPPIPRPTRVTYHPRPTRTRPTHAPLPLGSQPFFRDGYVNPNDGCGPPPLSACTRTHICHISLTYAIPTDGSFAQRVSRMHAHTYIYLPSHRACIHSDDRCVEPRTHPPTHQPTDPTAGHKNGIYAKQHFSR